MSGTVPVTHPSTNWAQHRVTVLIVTNVLPLSHTGSSSTLEPCEILSCNLYGSKIWSEVPKSSKIAAFSSTEVHG